MVLKQNSFELIFNQNPPDILINMSEPTPTTQYIYILGEDAVFEESLTNMLNAQTDKKAIRRKFTSQLDLLGDIDNYHPTLFLLNASSSIVVSDILSLIWNNPSSRNIHIIAIRYDSNVIDLFKPVPNSPEYIHSQKNILSWNDFSTIINEHCLATSF